MRTLTKKEKAFLLRKNIVLGNDLAERPEVLSEIGVRDERISKIAEEADAISLGVF